MKFNNKSTIAFLILLFFLFTVVIAQEKRIDLISLYKAHKFAQIKEYVNRIAVKDTTQMFYLFFTTIFLKNGEHARQNYEKVYKNASGELRELAAQRLHDYYYARGIYLKADKFKPKKNSVTSDTSTEVEIEKKLFAEDSPYKIQFGAFGRIENAEREQALLKKQNIVATVIRRRINGHYFYCVWVKGLKNIEETQKFADQIKQQFNLNYRIIKP